jgi:hypothetical protein
MTVWKNWIKCCEVTVSNASKMGIATSKNAILLETGIKSFK